MINKIKYISRQLNLLIVVTVLLTSESHANDYCEGLAAVRTTMHEWYSADWDEGVYLHYDVRVESNQKTSARSHTDEFVMFSSNDELRLINSRVELHRSKDVAIRILPDSRVIFIADGRVPEQANIDNMRLLSKLVQDSMMSGSAGVQCEKLIWTDGSQAWRVTLTLSPQFRRILSSSLQVEAVQFVVNADRAQLFEFATLYAEGQRVKSTSYVFNKVAFEVDRPNEWEDVDEIVFDGDAIKAEFATWHIRDVRVRK